jgi:hypothetical protein
MWMWTANESMQRSRTVNRCQIKNCKFKKRQRIKKRESERRKIREEKQESNLIRRFETVIKSLLLFTIEIAFSLIRFSLCLQFYIIHLHRFGFLKGQNDVISHLFVCVYIYIYIKRSGLSRVLPGQLPSGFLLRPGLVPGPGWLGPESTHRVGPDFKTMVPLSTIQDRSFKKALFGGDAFFFLVLRERCVVQN